MFKEERNDLMFEWGMIGDIGLGRPNLGPLMDVSVYRLMQFTLRDVMIKEYGVEATDDLFRKAGEEAGRHFCRNLIDTSQDFNGFIKQVKEILEGLMIGMLLVEKADLDAMRFTLSVAEDLDCSGLPISDETICVYDEGFIAGLLEEYTGNQFKVSEVDCWCSGDRVCRFEVDQLPGE